MKNHWLYLQTLIQNKVLQVTVFFSSTNMNKQILIKLMNVFFLLVTNLFLEMIEKHHEDPLKQLLIYAKPWRLKIYLATFYSILNKLFDDGNEVHYWTARGARSGKDWQGFTKAQLEGWGVKFTSIKMGKPHYDVWIDDKAINDKEYFWYGPKGLRTK